MAVPGPKYTSPRFFGHSNLVSMTPETEVNKSVFVDVGGNGDCGFRAVAAGLIDSFLVHPRGNGQWLTKVLANHFSYFPEQRTKLPGLVTAAERMQHLINHRHLSMRELLQTMAYTLRQMAVTELCTHPALYRGAFVDRNEKTTPNDMREPTTWIDESSIAALAKALAMSIEVRVIERGKTLPMRLMYNHQGEGHPSLVMQLQDHHYKPRVTLSERFSAVSSPVVRDVCPVTNALPNDPSLSDIHAAIAAEDMRLVTEFKETYHRLAIMVAAGELNKNDLLAMYATNMANSDYLCGRVAHVGVEHGNQQFFDAILRTQRGIHQAVLPAGEHHQDIVNELIHAIARAITIGQMNADDVFARIDETKEAGSHSVVG